MVLFGAPVLLFVAAKYWRESVLLAMVLMVFEGALRKWAVPGAQAQMYLLKDVILIGAYAGFALSGEGLRLPPPLRNFAPLAFIYGIYGALEILNLNSPSLVVGLIGWKSYFLYMPLLWIVPHLFRSVDDVEFALKRFLIIGIPVAALGFIQFLSPADDLVNAKVTGTAGEEIIATFGEDSRQRTSGTFSFVGGYTEYLVALAATAMFLLAANDWRIRGRGVVAVALALAVGALFTTGSRHPFLSLSIALLTIFGLQLKSGDATISTVRRALFVFGACAAAVILFATDPIEAFRYRVDTAGDDLVERVLEPFLQPFELIAQAGLFGFGIGTTHNAVLFLTGASDPWWLRGIDVEAESARVLVELGLVGFVLHYGLQVYLLATGIRLSRTMTLPAARRLAVCTTAVIAYHIPSFIVNNPTANLIYWFSAGLFVVAASAGSKESEPTQQREHVPQPFPKAG
jgi:hypothetical protein